MHSASARPWVPSKTSHDRKEKRLSADHSEVGQVSVVSAFLRLQDSHLVYGVGSTCEYKISLVMRSCYMAMMKGFCNVTKVLNQVESSRRGSRPSWKK